MAKVLVSLYCASVAIAFRVEHEASVNISSGYPPCNTVGSCGRNGHCRVQKGCFPLDNCRCKDGNGQVLLCHNGKEVPLSDVCVRKAQADAAWRKQRDEERRWKRQYRWTRGPAPRATPFHYGKPGNTLNFMIIGDFGGSSDSRPTTGAQWAVAHGMGKAGEIFKPSFVLGLGDNFYPVGVHHHNRWRLEASYNGVYTHKSLHVPWYNIAGNHDWAGPGSIQTQIDYTKENHRWVLPSAHYTFRKSLPLGRTIKFVMFDHHQLNKRKRYTPLPWSEGGRAKLQGVEWSEQPFRNHDEAWGWLDKELANSDDDYLILVDHHPVITVCSHGDTTSLRAFPGMMRKYRVTAFMSGHDHCAMTIQHEGNTFILQGAASQAWNQAFYQQKVEAMGGKVLYSIHRDNKNGVAGSFSTAEALDSGLTIRHHDNHGNVLSQMPPLQPRK